MSGFLLLMHEEYEPLMKLFRTYYRQDDDPGNCWFDDCADSVDIEEFLTENDIPYTTEEDSDDMESGVYITRFYAPEHKNNTAYSYQTAHSELVGLLNDPQDKKLYAQLQDRYNPPKLPQDIKPNKEQIARVVYFTLTGLPKDL